MSRNIRAKNTGRKNFTYSKRLPDKENCCYFCRATLEKGHILVTTNRYGDIVASCPDCYGGARHG